jgi:hypothetical protein
MATARKAKARREEYPMGLDWWYTQEPRSCVQAGPVGLSFPPNGISVPNMFGVLFPSNGSGAVPLRLQWSVYPIVKPLTAIEIVTRVN